MKLSDLKVAFCLRALIHGLQLVLKCSEARNAILTTMARKRFSKSFGDESNAVSQGNVTVLLDVDFPPRWGQLLYKGRTDGQNQAA